MKITMTLQNAVITLSNNIRWKFDFTIYATVKDNIVDFSIPKHDINSDYVVQINKSLIKERFINFGGTDILILKQDDALRMLQYAYNISQRSSKLDNLLKEASTATSVV